jgi:hypothetical protein
MDVERSIVFVFFSSSRDMVVEFACRPSDSSSSLTSKITAGSSSFASR